MKKILLAVILLLPVALCAQELRAPDNDRILMEILDAASPHYYPHLMSRYMKGDRALTAEDYHYLYYGYAYQASYAPLEPQPAVDDMLMVLERSSEPDSLQCVNLIGYGREAMKSDPFNPVTLNLIAFAYTILGDTVEARNYAIRVERVLGTIKSSGTGLTERSPWVVLAFSHTDAVLASMELQVKTRRVVSRTVEYVEPRVLKGKEKGYYFDFGRAYWNKPERTPEPQKRGWEINGIKVK